MRSGREEFRSKSAAYFVSTQTAGRRPFFRHERWAELLKETMLHYARTEYSLHAYVIMPDHFHVLLVPYLTLEKAVQVIKGGFSFRAKRAFDWKFDVWQQGFSDHRIRDAEDWQGHLEYTRRNPVKAGLVEDGGVYPYVDFPSPEFPQGLKPLKESGVADVRAKARTLQGEDDDLSAAESEFPQGLKPFKESGVADVRAKARTLQKADSENR
ncbi:MAG TPA: transposase [Terracidiphilus sp.]|nr:transposase [Terracidiphilus sp.]